MISMTKKYISPNKDLAITCVLIMNDIQFKIEQYFGINVESLDVDDDSNTIIESNEDATEFEANNVMTVTEPVQLESTASCATIPKNTNKQQYNAIRKEINSSVHQRHKIPSYYHFQKKYCPFIGGKHKNNNNPNIDDILKSPNDINLDMNEKKSYTLDTIEEVENKEDISTTLGDDDNNETKKNFKKLK